MVVKTGNELAVLRVAMMAVEMVVMKALQLAELLADSLGDFWAVVRVTE